MIAIKMNKILTVYSVSCVFYNIVYSAPLNKRESKTDSRENSLNDFLEKEKQIRESTKPHSKANIIAEPGEVAYGVQLNGDTQKAPPWPRAAIDNEEMFLLPKVFQFDEKVRITGQMSRRERITASLLTELNGSPNYSEIACQAEVLFVEDKINLRTILNNATYPSTDDETPSQVFRKDLSFDFAFVPKTIGDSSFIEFEIDGSVYGKVDLKHSLESIRFVSVQGDVERFTKLDYVFAPRG